MGVNNHLDPVNAKDFKRDACLLHVAGKIAGSIEPCAKYDFDFNKTKIVKSLNDFLAMPEIKKYFTDKPEREIKTEVEFIDKTGALRRMDRLVFDDENEKEIVLIDFKTGAENTEGYKKQMADYTAILSEVYKDFNIKAVIAYIDLQKIVKVEL